MSSAWNKETGVDLPPIATTKQIESFVGRQIRTATQTSATFPKTTLSTPTILQSIWGYTTPWAVALFTGAPTGLASIHPISRPEP